MTDLDRRELIGASVLTAAVVAALPVTADAATKAAIDVKDPRAMMMILARLQGDVSGKTLYGYQKGQVFGLIGGAGLPLADYGRRLYDYEGAGVSRSRVLPNGDVETKSRSWLFYTDAATGAYIKTWRNPMTGKDVTVPPVPRRHFGWNADAQGTESERQFHDGIDRVQPAYETRIRNHW